MKSRSANDKAGIPATYFAPAERATRRELCDTIRSIGDSPLLKAMLEVLGGWVAVLNRNREVLTANFAFLRMLGVADPENLLGLRLGEALHCPHARDHIGGCGTSRYCATCGAAISMVAAQETGAAQERECVLSTETDGARQDRTFAVHCTPFEIEGNDLLLIAMRDISDEKRRMALERIFLHDLSNTLAALSGATRMLMQSQSPERADLLERIQEATDLLIREVKLQRLLCREQLEACSLEAESVRPSEVMERIRSVFASHPIAEGQVLVVQPVQNDEPLATDIGLLSRVLANMVTNAFEAGGSGDEVRMGVEASADEVTFHVWNRQAIPEGVCLRVFQKYFSTKPEGGRGLGTYSMKLLGETLLKGRVSFSTSAAAGTTFRICLPRHLGEGHVSRL